MHTCATLTLQGYNVYRVKNFHVFKDIFISREHHFVQRQTHTDARVVEGYVIGNLRFLPWGLMWGPFLLLVNVGAFSAVGWMSVFCFHAMGCWPVLGLFIVGVLYLYKPRTATACQGFTQTENNIAYIHLVYI